MRNEIIVFLQTTQRAGSTEHQIFLENNWTSMLFAFLADIFHHINILNYILQQKESLMFQLLAHVATIGEY